MECASGWGDVNFFLCSSDWGNSNKVKNVKNGGNHVRADKTSIHKHGSPLFNICNFFRISPARSTLSKKF